MEKIPVLQQNYTGNMTQVSMAGVQEHQGIKAGQRLENAAASQETKNTREAQGGTEVIEMSAGGDSAGASCTAEMEQQ